MGEDAIADCGAHAGVSGFFVHVSPWGSTNLFTTVPVPILGANLPIFFRTRQ